jgi:hypothetical protein
MPISAEKMKCYPGGGIKSKIWLAFRSEILQRAEMKCEGTPQRPHCSATNGEPHPETGAVLCLQSRTWIGMKAMPILSDVALYASVVITNGMRLCER